MKEVDYRKMMQQEPDFDKYVRTIIVEMILADPQSQILLQSIHNFWQIGNTAQDVVKFFKGMRISDE